MTDRLKRIDRTLLELWTGILLFGILCQCVVALPFPIDRIKYAIGLWTGILVAVLSAFHMWFSLNRAFGYDEKTASRKLAGGYVIRYLVTAAFLLLLYFTDAGYVLAGFLGVMGLKAGAFVQPLTHKFFNRIFRDTVE
ncbi:MAG: ATP synthase subunit I [Lachnospiraceae bacterium]